MDAYQLRAPNKIHLKAFQLVTKGAVGNELHHGIERVNSFHSTIKFTANMPFINTSTCEQAVRGVVTSRLDYSNALLHGISSSDIKRLQRVQNRADC